MTDTSPVVVVARVDVRKLLPAFDSENERWWHTHGALIIGNEFDCPVALTHYHAHTWHLPGGTYTPDFTHILDDGRLVVVEVKALILKNKIIDHADGTSEVKQVSNNRVQHGYRDARTKLRTAAACYPWATWVEARIGKRGDYELEIIN